MPELRQEYLDILEKREWSVSGYTDDGRVELEWWSPAGEDFLVCVNVENFPDEILDYSDDFDPDEHIEMWVEARANGRQDVPGARRLAIFNPHELVNITKIVWDKLDRLKDNLDKEAAKQEASDAGKK